MDRVLKTLMEVTRKNMRLAIEQVFITGRNIVIALNIAFRHTRHLRL